MKSIISHFQKKQQPLATLGLTWLLDSQINPPVHEPNMKRISNVKQHGRALVNGLLFESQRQKLDIKENLDRTIQIDRLNVGIADFDIDDTTKENLISSGRKSVQNYFEKKFKSSVNINISQKQ